MISKIFYSGNILYNSTGKVTTLLVSDLPKYIKLYNFIYHIQELNSLIGNIFVDNESFNSIAFSQLEHVIVKHKYLILVIGDSALSIIYGNPLSMYLTRTNETHMACLIAMEVQ